MRKMSLPAALAIMTCLAVPAMAETAPPAASNTQANPAVPDVAEFDKQMARALENMKMMQDQMAKIQQTRDPAERQKLLQDHWVTMQNNMQLMHGMSGMGMMGCCGGNAMMGGHMMGGHMMGWPDASGYYSTLTPEQARQRQYMMDRYTGMQQMMMDHMMQHQGMMWMGPR